MVSARESKGWRTDNSKSQISNRKSKICDLPFAIFNSGSQASSCMIRLTALTSTKPRKCEAREPKRD
jgi:hypothetical protein